MPLIGLSIGHFITSKIILNTNILVGIILSLIAVEMLISSFKEKEEKFLLSVPGYLLFGLSYISTCILYDFLQNSYFVIQKVSLQNKKSGLAHQIIC